MRVVANLNEVEKGAMIIEAANKNCDTAHAVVMLIWYRWMRLRICESGREVVWGGCWAMSSEGNDIRMGRKMELVKEIMENRTRAKDPFLAISPTMSFDDCSIAALSAF